MKALSILMSLLVASFAFASDPNLEMGQSDPTQNAKWGSAENIALLSSIALYANNE